MKITIPTLSVTVNEFPDYVNNCPCIFTKEYMMKKIRKKRKALIKEILDTFEQNRTTIQPIKLVDTEETEVTELEYNTDFFRYPVLRYDTEDVVINIDFANMPTKGVLKKKE